MRQRSRHVLVGGCCRIFSILEPSVPPLVRCGLVGKCLGLYRHSFFKPCGRTQWYFFLKIAVIFGSAFGNGSIPSGARKSSRSDREERWLQRHPIFQSRVKVNADFFRSEDPHNFWPWFMRGENGEIERDRFRQGAMNFVLDKEDCRLKQIIS